MSNPEFGDGGEAEAAGDDDVDWRQVDLIAEQIDDINAIADDGDRLAAAKDWAGRLAEAKDVLEG